MVQLKEQYYTSIVPALQKDLDLKNPLEVPKIEKVTINSGLSSKRDAKFIETLQNTLRRISGQEPVVTRARKSVSGFKIREGMPLGVKVTLRRGRMWSFVYKLVNVVFPRVRDFRGLDASCVDASGNFNVGFDEHIAFPEINADEVDNLHGLQVTITTTANSYEEGLALFKALGFPFKKEAQS